MGYRVGFEETVDHGRGDAQGGGGEVSPRYGIPPPPPLWSLWFGVGGGYLGLRGFRVEGF